jgi:hypothetical protein
MSWGLIYAIRQKPIWDKKPSGKIAACDEKT